MGAPATDEMPLPNAAGTRNDYYATLGVARDATTDDITAAYKRAAMKHHPDRHATKTDAERNEHAQMFKACAQAHDVLSDREKRLQYDLFGAEGVTGGVSDADARARDMFEGMFGVGGAAPKQRRVVGGAMFVSGDQFFQRSWAAADVDRMRREMAEAFPAVERDGGEEGAPSYTARTALPHGSAWEVRLVEADGDSLMVTLTAEDKEGDAPATLRIERTIALPSTAGGPAWDVLGAEVAVDDAGVLRVTVAREGHTLADGAPPSQSVPTEALPVEGAVGTDSAEGKPTPASPATSPPEDGVPPRTSPKPKRRVRRARRPQTEGMRAGFLNTKPPPAPAQATTKAKPMDMDVAPPSVAKAPSARDASPVSVREVDDELGAMMWAQMDEFGTDGHDPDVMDRGSWPDDVVLPQGFCPLSV